MKLELDDFLLKRAGVERIAITLKNGRNRTISKVEFPLVGKRGLPKRKRGRPKLEESEEFQRILPELFEKTCADLALKYGKSISTIKKWRKRAKEGIRKSGGLSEFLLSCALRRNSLS